MWSRSAITGVILTVSIASGAMAGPSLRITTNQASGASPFAVGGEHDCSVDRRNPGWEWETSVAAHPHDRKTFAVAWLQDEALGIVVASTRDGGRTWARSVVPGLTTCTGGSHNRVFHPRLAYSANGTLFLASHPTSEAGPDPRNVMTDVYLSRSGDGGKSWDAPTGFVDLPVLGDFDTMTTEPTGREIVDVLWTAPEAVGPEPVYLSRSTDGGNEWQTSLVGRGSAGNVAFNQVLALPDGSIVVFIADTPISTFTPAAGLQPIITYVKRSADGGRTWSDPVEVGRASFEEWPQATVAQDGTIHYLYRTRSGGDIHAWLTSSSDGGLTFSDARLAFSYPEPENIWSRPSFAAGAAGTLGFFYYATDEEGQVQPRLVHSSDNGMNWHETDLMPPFHRSSVPYGDEGGGLGLYNSLTSVGCGFLASVPAGRPAATSGPTDVFAVTVEQVGDGQECHQAGSR